MLLNPVVTDAISRNWVATEHAYSEATQTATDLGLVMAAASILLLSKADSLVSPNFLADF